jgi:hypothetical protein
VRTSDFSPKKCIGSLTALPIGNVPAGIHAIPSGQRSPEVVNAATFGRFRGLVRGGLVVKRAGCGEDRFGVFARGAGRSITADGAFGSVGSGGMGGICGEGVGRFSGEASAGVVDKTEGRGAMEGRGMGGTVVSEGSADRVGGRSRERREGGEASRISKGRSFFCAEARAPFASEGFVVCVCASGFEREEEGLGENHPSKAPKATMIITTESAKAPPISR